MATPSVLMSSLFALALLLPAASPAANAPVVVAPGSPQASAVLGTACPTFHWGYDGKAEHYELAIYAAGPAQASPTPRLVQKLPGAATGWTPSLEHCLEPGAQYAWSIRAITPSGPSDWSARSFFRIGPHSRAMELEQAIAVINDVLAEQPVVQRTSAPAASTPAAAPKGAITQLEVAGGVVGTTFSGDGSGLSNINADTLDGVDGSGYAGSNQACPAGSYVQAIDATGSVVCAALADYVNQSCHLYFGWNDNCNGCTSPPAKWGQVSGSSCTNGSGVNNTCQTPTLGSEAVTLFGLNTSGEVDANDKFYIGLKCL